MVRIIILLTLFCLSFNLIAQKAKEKPVNTRLTPSIKFIDANNDDTISIKEAQNIFALYRNNPGKQIENEIVNDVEVTIVELINYLEDVNCKDKQKTIVSKRFIETYYKCKFSTQPDTVVTYCIRKLPNDPCSLIIDSTLVLKTKIEKNLKTSGLIDMYYSYDINNPSNNSLVGSSGAGRVFDRYHNQIMLSMAQTKFEYITNKSRALIDLTYGLGGEIANYGNSGTSLIIKQVFVSHYITKKIMITAGNFATHIGYEVIEASNNFNYSVSNLFANGPFYHSGIKGDYQITEKINLMGGIVAGWDKIQDDNKAKSIIGQLTYKPSDKASVFINWIGGNEAPSSLTGDTIKAYKQLFDLVAILNIKKKITIGINSAYGISNFDNIQKTWGGAALYFQYRFTKKLSGGLRTEYFDDSQKVQYLGAGYFGNTVTFCYSPIENVTLKAEARSDEASQPIYWKNKNNELTKTQTTFGLAIIGTF